jgi:hypothetical protein
VLAAADAASLLLVERLFAIVEPKPIFAPRNGRTVSQAAKSEKPRHESRGPRQPQRTSGCDDHP